MNEYLPARYVREFTAIAQAHHYDVDALLNAAGIHGAADTIDEPSITFSQCDRLYKLLSQKMDDVCLGIHGHRTPESYVRLLLNYLVQAATLREALALAIEFFALSDRQLRAGKADSPVQVAAALDCEGELAHFSLYSRRDQYSVISDLHDIASLHRVLSWLIGIDLTLREVRVMAAPEGAWEVYGDVLDCPVYFSHARNVLTFDAKCLDFSIRQNAAAIRTALEFRPYEILFPRAARQRAADIVAAVKNAIGSNFSDSPPSLEAVAALLAMAPRRLRWALQKAGTSFQQLKNDNLRDAAIGYLQKDNLSVAQVAELLGFSDAGAFNRSFKRLTGVPPGVYRERQRGEVTR